MKHTQGKWINLGYRVDVDIADGLSGICEMSDWMGKDEMEANAKLIAAAPELLSIVLELQESASYWSEYDVPIGIVERIDNAIKKATE
jgi:hypothetical protein